MASNPAAAFASTSACPPSHAAPTLSTTAPPRVPDCRQGMGVTGGQPFGFDVGAKPGRGGAGIRGLDLGVRGMRVGGRRKLLIPPNLAYGDKVGWQA